MKIRGLQKLTLLDYPGKVACTLFTVGCDFQCPFCHNSGLLRETMQEPPLSECEVFEFLGKRRGLLDGVCITGGEPALQSDLEAFIETIRDMGYLVKLDTNGYHPDALEALLTKNLLNYVAMDVKNSPLRYAQTCGVSDVDIEKIDASVRILKQSTIPYEFRTTVCRELHTEDDIRAIGEWIFGCREYYLQSYRFSEQVMQPIFSAYSVEEMDHLLSVVRTYIPTAKCRGNG